MGIPVRLIDLHVVLATVQLSPELKRNYRQISYHGIRDLTQFLSWMQSDERTVFL